MGFCKAPGAPEPARKGWAEKYSRDEGSDEFLSGQTPPAHRGFVPILVNPTVRPKAIVKPTVKPTIKPTVKLIAKPIAKLIVKNKKSVSK